MDITWRKSSHSSSNGGNCVEVGLWGAAAAAARPGRSTDDGDDSGELAAVGAAPWRTSTRSTSNGGSCVETATIGAAVAIRDTKDGGHGPVLRFTPTAWHAFTITLK